MERLESWLPIMLAQTKKTKGKENKKFVMVCRPAPMLSSPHPAPLRVAPQFTLLTKLCVFSSTVDGSVPVNHGHGMIDGGGLSIRLHRHRPIAAL